MNSLSDVDAAWVAGWLCADGSIIPGPPPKIRWVITDRDVLDRVQHLLGVNAVGGPYAPSGLGKLDRYEYAISGQKALELGDRLAPWLSIRYGERLAEAHARWSPQPRGRVITEADALAIHERLRAGGHGTGRALAREYGVSEGLISAIKRGRIWKVAA